MKQSFYLILFLTIQILVSTSLFSQTTEFIVSGKVTDEKNQPLIGVSVFIEEIKKGTITNKYGDYHIANIPLRNIHVQFSYIGYAKKIISISIEKNFTLNIKLQSTDIQSKEYIVSDSLIKQKDVSILLLTYNELKKNSEQNFAETLKKLPGMYTWQTGPSISKPMIKGLHSQRVLIINNEQQQNTQEWGAEHPPLIEPFSIHNIEMIRGVKAIQYGTDMIGGIIKTFPFALDYETIFKGNIAVNFLSNNLQSTLSILTQGGFSIEQEKFAWMIQLNGRIASDAETPTYRIANTAFHNTNTIATIGYKKNNIEIKAHYSIFYSELGMYPGASFSSIAELIDIYNGKIPPIQRANSFSLDYPQQKLLHQNASLQFQIQEIQYGKFDILYGLQNNVRNELDVQDKPAGLLLDLWIHSLSMIFSHTPTAHWSGKIGIQSDIQLNKNKGSSSLIPDYTAYSCGVFGFETWSSKQFEFSLGARYSFKEYEISAYRNPLLAKQIASGEIAAIRTYHTFAFIAEAFYYFTKEHFINIDISYTSRPPSLIELHSDGIHPGTAQYEKGNPNLQSEKSLSFNCIHRYNAEHIKSETAAYTSYIFDFIFLYPSADPYRSENYGLIPSFEYAQVNTLLFGISQFIEYEPIEWLQFHLKVAANFGFTLLHFDPMYQMPPPRITFGIQFKLPDYEFLKDSYVEISTDGILKQYLVPNIATNNLSSSLVSNSSYVEYLKILSISPNGYALLHCSFGTTINIGKGIDIVFSIKDILNIAHRDYLSRYRMYIDDVGRNFSIRLQYHF